MDTSPHKLTDFGMFWNAISYQDFWQFCDALEPGAMPLMERRSIKANFTSADQLVLGHPYSFRWTHVYSQCEIRIPHPSLISMRVNYAKVCIFITIKFKNNNFLIFIQVYYLCYFLYPKWMLKYMCSCHGCLMAPHTMMTL